eukprot:g1180.t1
MVGRIAAYVGVRAGSKRCPNKNSKPFWGGASLIDVKLRTLLRVADVDTVFFSSESEELLEIGRAYESQGVVVKKRDPYFATATVSNAEMFWNCARVVGDEFDHVLYAPVTSPLMEVEDFDHLLAGYRSSDPAQVDAFASVIEHQGHFFFEDRPLNFAPVGPEAARGTQYSQPLLELGYAAAVIDRERLLQTKSIIGSKMPPGFVVLPQERGLEIDTCFEFDFCQWAYERRHGLPPDWKPGLVYQEGGGEGEREGAVAPRREEL